MPNVASSGQLAKQLKAGTQESHREAENVHFVREFIKGRIDRDVYRVMVSMFYYVYCELEHQMRQAAAAKDPIFTPLHFPIQLERVPSLEQDLAYFYGLEWKETIPPPSKATKDYIARLRYVGKTQPALLVSHAYTRYMGDLSGGQILKRTAIRSMNLPDGEGTVFYDFEHILTSHKAFKDMYRRTLDGLPVTPDLACELVKEANLAFLLNMTLFEELDVLGGFTTPEAQREEAASRRRRSSSPKKKLSCPFASLVGQPGVKELAMKYHGDEMTEEEMKEFEIEYASAQEENRRQKNLLQGYAISLTALGIAIGFGFACRRLCTT